MLLQWTQHTPPLARVLCHPARFIFSPRRLWSSAMYVYPSEHGSDACCLTTVRLNISPRHLENVARAHKSRDTDVGVVARATAGNRDSHDIYFAITQTEVLRHPREARTDLAIGESCSVVRTD